MGIGTQHAGSCAYKHRKHEMDVACAQVTLLLNNQSSHGAGPTQGCQGGAGAGAWGSNALVDGQVRSPAKAIEPTLDQGVIVGCCRGSVVEKTKVTTKRS